MNGEDVELQATDDGAFSAYVVAPAGPGPGLLLMQYVSGVNAVMRGLADGFAAQGFVVACPDLFWRQEPNVRINNDPANPVAGEQDKAMALNAGFDDEKGLLDLVATLAYLRRHSLCSGRVGGLGYCLGGRTAYLMAARSDIDCAVGYYGVNIQAYLDDAARIERPLMLHHAAADALCPPQARDAIFAGLASNPQIVLHEYPGAGHAFALAGGANYDPEAARLADERSQQFLRDHLY